MQTSRQSPFNSLHNRIPWLVALVLFALTPTSPAHGYGVFQTLQHQVIGFESLDEATTAALSPDGRHLYVAGRDAVMVLARDGLTGDLSPVQTLEADLDGFAVFFFDSMVISPDGSSVYASSITYSAVVVFSRNPTDGRLEVVETLSESSPDIEGLNKVVDLEISHDGQFLYSVGFEEAEIGVFRRSGTTGALTQVEVENDGGEIADLQQPRGAAITPDGHHFYVADRFGGLLIFSRDVTTGELTFEKTVEGNNLIIDRPLNVVVDPSGTSVYLAGTGPSLGRIVSTFTRDPSSGDLVKIEDHDNLDHIFQLLVDPSGENLYITSEDRVTIFDRDSQGRLSLQETLINGIDGVEGLAGSGLGVLDPESRHLYVPAFADESVAIFERDEATGALTFTKAIFDGEGVSFDGLAAIASVHVTANGRDVYLLGAENNVLTYYRRDAGGNLTLVQAEALREAGFPTTSTIRQLLVTPDERHLIVVDHSKQLWVYARNPTTGNLSFSRSQFLEAVDPSDFVFSQDSRFLFTPSLFTDVVIWEIDPTTGELTFRSGFGSGNDRFQKLAVSPTGRFLYGTSTPSQFGDSAKINIFEWDETSNSLTFVDEITDTAFGAFITHLSVSPDGRFLYATGAQSINIGSPGLVIFERQSDTGELTKIQTWNQGNIGPNGSYRLGALSHSGTRLMVSSQTASVQPPTSNFFDRDPTTGMVTLLEQRSQGDGRGPADIRSYLDLAWSPAGDQFYVSSALTNRLYAFDEGVVTPCVASSTTLCLGENGRFSVEVTWTDFVGETGVGTRVVESADSGLFWFFERDNWEMLVKVIDGCENNGHHWVFAAATTNVAYTLTVTDTLNNVPAIYENRLGDASPAITDNMAFATCP